MMPSHAIVTKLIFAILLHPRQKITSMRSITGTLHIFVKSSDAFMLEGLNGSMPVEQLKARIAVKTGS